jgi:hypothetical protein
MTFITVRQFYSSIIITNVVTFNTVNDSIRQAPGLSEFFSL